MAIVTQVSPPRRRPRAGGIKAVVGEFQALPRVSEGIVWEDSGCALPKPTWAGCFDSVFPLVYDPVEITDGGVVFTFTREGDEVTVSATLDGDDYEGFAAPWAPLEPVDVFIGEGHVLISTDGDVSFTDAPAGELEASYQTEGTDGGHYPPKDFRGIDHLAGIGEPFALYDGVECFIGGAGAGRSYLEQARTLLEQGEDRGVEERLWAWAWGGDDVGTHDTVTEAIAALEQRADGEYVGQPVLVMSRASATVAFAEGALELVGGNLVTANGTPVIASGAVENGFVAIIGATEVYVTPVVAALAVHPTTNIEMAIAERIYAVAVDCEFRLVAEVGA